MSIKDNNTINNEYSSDSPILLDDKNYLLWTKRIVEEIESIIEVVDTSEESYVIWLQWEWWAWKSSIVKSLKENLWYKIFNYSPRIYGNEVDLYEKFFDEFSKFLQLNKFCSNDNNLEGNILEYKLNLNKNINIPLNKFWNKLAEIFLNLICYWSLSFYIWYQQFSIRIEDISKWLIYIFLWVSIIIFLFWVYSLIDLIFIKYNQNKYLKNKRNIYTIRNDISSALWLLNKKIVIVIDDIDRLKPDKIANIFQLIKSIANFKNIVYILCYDKNLIIKSIDKEYQQPEKNHIDKFIQMEINIPKAPFYWISQLLLDSIYSFIDYSNIKYPKANYSINEKEKKELVDFLKSKKCKSKFYTIRAVKRFSNIIRIDLNILQKYHDSDEVYIYDFVLITLIKYMDEEFYNWIYNKVWYTLFSWWPYWKEMLNKNKEIIDKELKSRFEWREDIFYILFPLKYNWLNEINSNRICNYNKFDTYFSFAVYWLSNSQFNEIIEKLKDKSNENIIIEQLNNDNYVRDLLKKLNNYINEKIYNEKNISDILLLLIFVINNENRLNNYEDLLRWLEIDISRCLTQFLDHFVSSPTDYKKHFLYILNNVDKYSQLIMYVYYSLNLDHDSIKKEEQPHIYDKIISDQGKLWENLVKELNNLVKDKFLLSYHNNQLHNEVRWCSAIKVAENMWRLESWMVYKYINENKIWDKFIKTAILWTISQNKDEEYEDRDIELFLSHAKLYFTKKEYWKIISNYTWSNFDKKILERILQKWKD